MLLLSYALNAHTPMYGNGPSIQVIADKQMAKQDSCNTLKLSLPNHAGTHLDCPAHFDPTGRTLTDYDPDFWYCAPVQILSHDLAPGELCGTETLNAAYQQAPVRHPDAQIVLLITGWHQRRQDKEYWETPPGFLPETAAWLRDTFPRLRFFGFDLLSLSSFAHRETGRAAHHAYLRGSHPILIIEDMDLSETRTLHTLRSVLVSPLFIDHADGAPCTVWGITEN